MNFVGIIKGIKTLITGAQSLKFNELKDVMELAIRIFEKISDDIKDIKDDIKLLKEKLSN